MLVKLAKLCFSFQKSFPQWHSKTKIFTSLILGGVEKSALLHSLYHFMFSLIGVSSSICSLTVIIIFLDSQYDRQNFSMNSFFQLLFIFFPNILSTLSILLWTSGGVHEREHLTLHLGIFLLNELKKNETTHCLNKKMYQYSVYDMVALLLRWSGKSFNN